MAASATATRIGPQTKRAARVADRIVEDVIAAGWPVGSIIGSEAELVARYQVSRAVFREAVRLLEYQQVAQTRRGPGGGLVITKPTAGAVIDAVVLYLYRVEARLDELFEARIVLEETAAGLASSRLREPELSRLRGFTADTPTLRWPDPRSLHSLILRAETARAHARRWPARPRHPRRSIPVPRTICTRRSPRPRETACSSSSRWSSSA